MVCYQLSQETVEQGMRALMKLVESDHKVFSIFSEVDLITILHHVQDIYAEEPIMLEFDLPKNGLVVVGDLHGDLYCLLKILLKNGFPPDTSYLFLGDYVDRGSYQVQLMLFIFLMKLRWPNYITTLKGNHEDYHCCMDRGFFKACWREFHDGHRWFTYFNHVFDHMPVCAIISNHFFACHGGISQWMTCKSNLQNIPKPTYTSDMHFVEGVILADLLWADPIPQQQKWFALSRRSVGYTFSQEALAHVLDAIGAKTLIRGHEYFPGGTCRNFDDDTCYTVHSTTDPRNLYDPFSGILILEKVDDKFEVTESNGLILRNGKPNSLAHEMQAKLRHAFLSTIISYNRSKCQWCQQPFPFYVPRRKRCFMYSDIANYMMKNGKAILLAENLIRELPWRGIYWRNNSAMSRAVELFPITNDIIFGRPSPSDIPRTFRVWMLAKEFELMKKVYKASGNSIDHVKEPNFRNIADADKELKAPATRFKKFTKQIKLAMGLEPQKLQFENRMARPAALPLLSFDTVGDLISFDVDENEGRTLDDATEGEGTETEEIEEEPNEEPTTAMPFDTVPFYQPEPFDNTQIIRTFPETRDHSENQ